MAPRGPAVVGARVDSSSTLGLMLRVEPAAYSGPVDTRGPLARHLGRLNPLVVDAALALGLAAITLIEIATSRGCGCFSTADVWWSAAFMLTQTLPLALRRRYPFAVFAVIGVSAIAYDLLSIPPDPNTAIFALLVGLYSVSAYARRPLAVAAAVITGVAFAGLNVPGIVGREDFASLANQLLLLGGAWVVGQNARYRRRQAELLHERAARTEREQRERERVAALEERSRLAREIHDVLAHSVSVIAVQAGAARAVAERRPDRAREALGAIEKVSKQTMTELRRTLGAIRGPTDDLTMRPAPGLKDLDDLVEQVRRAGLDVEVSTVGKRCDLPVGVDLSAYRIVQESLTNAIKHAGPTTVRIQIAYESGWLELVISDDGPRTACPPGRTRVAMARQPEGTGLLGIRERIAILARVVRGGTERSWLRGPGPAPARVEDGGPVSIRVLLADDQALVRSGFRMLVETEPDMEVVAEAADGREAVSETMRTRPDVVLMDVRMPQVDGIEATRTITDPGTGLDSKVLILTTYDLDEYVFRGASRRRERVPAEGRRARGPDPGCPPSRRGRVAAVPVGHPPPDRAVRPYPCGSSHTSARGRRADRAGARGPDPDRPRPVQQRDRGSPVSQRCDREDAREPRLRQAPTTRPRPSSRADLRDRLGPSWRAGGGPDDDRRSRVVASSREPATRGRLPRQSQAARLR